MPLGLISGNVGIDSMDPVLFADLDDQFVPRMDIRTVARCAFVQQTITVERDECYYIVSARFILEASVIELNPKDERHWHFLDSVELRCKVNERDIIYLPVSDAFTPAHIKTTESQTWDSSIDAGASPHPNLKFKFSIVKNGTITRETETGSWVLTAGRAFSERMLFQFGADVAAYYTWLWKSKTRSLGCVPDDVKISMRRVVTVTRHIPIRDLNPGVPPSFDFDVIVSTMAAQMAIMET